MASGIKNMLLAGSVCVLLFCAGCSGAYSLESFSNGTHETDSALTKVIIHFDSQDKLETWVKDLGIGEGEDLYAGGASRCYYYDQDGNVKGVYNYQRVTYIEIAN